MEQIVAQGHDWQKAFVVRMLQTGLTHTQAMIAMAETCEERQMAYMQGYNRGYDCGYAAGFKKKEKP